MDKFDEIQLVCRKLLRETTPEIQQKYIRAVIYVQNWSDELTA